MSDWINLDDIPMSASQRYMSEFFRASQGRDMQGRRRRQPFGTVRTATSLAADVWEAVQDHPGADQNTVILAVFGLDPLLPWAAMGISDSGCEDGDIANADYGTEKIPQELKDRMHENLHYAHLLISQEARDLAEEFGDPVWSRMKASDPRWWRTISSSPQAAATPDWELTSDEDQSQYNEHHDTDTSSFNFSAPPGGYSLKGLALLKELFAISLPVRFRLIKLHNSNTYSLVFTVQDGPARVHNSVISSRAAEKAQISGTRLWTVCALQLSSALQWPAL